MKRIPLAAIVSLLLSSPLFSEEPIRVYSGDGIKVSVFFEDEDTGEVGGEVSMGGAVHPFTGTAEDDGSVEGSLIIAGKTQAFTASTKGDAITLVTGGKTYQLNAGNAPAPRPAPAPVPRVEAVAEMPAMSLKKVVLRDVTMGGVVSHTMLIPTDWNLAGHVEWSKDGTASWQFNFKITGPKQEKIAAIPAITLSYTESKRMQMAPQGTPPPRDLGAWIVEVVKQTNREVSEVRLIEQHRDAAEEEAQRVQAQQLGGGNPGISLESHVVTIGYQQNGVLMREEMKLTYARYAPIDNINIRSQMWTLFTNGMIAAPDADFARMRPQLLAIAGTIETVPKWWNQMMQVRGQIMQKKSEEAFAEIRRRGEMYDRISDEQFASWKRWNDQDNEAQRKRIQGIYEVQDYRDRDGSRVELPFHHKYVFSDGRGNYVLSNDYNSKPGEGFEEIQADR